MSRLRDLIALSLRTMPRFRGKSHLGVALGYVLNNNMNDQDCIQTIKMRDGNLMQLDVRSRTERWAYWTGEYDAKIISRLASCLKPNAVVFDVGANIGFYSIPLGAQMKALNGTLYAFEPVPSNFERIQTQIALNQLEEIIQPHQIALGQEEGWVEMWVELTQGSLTGNAVILKDELDKASCGTAPEASSGKTKVQLTKLDTFVEKHQIDTCHLIKIDVEGAEYMFLQGGAKFLSQHRPIIYGEFNTFWMEKFGHSFLDVVALTKPWGYRFFKQIKGFLFVEIGKPEPGIENVLLLPCDISETVLNKIGIVSQ